MGEWIRELEERIGMNPEIIECDEPIGEGWNTMAQLMADSDYGEIKTRRIIKQAILAGEAEVKNGTTIGVTGLKVRQVWYRIKKAS